MIDVACQTLLMSPSPHGRGASNNQPGCIWLACNRHALCRDERLKIRLQALVLAVMKASRSEAHSDGKL